MRHSCPISMHENLKKRIGLAIQQGDISIILKTLSSHKMNKIIREIMQKMSGARQ